MKLVVLYILAVPLVVLGFTGASVLLDSAYASILAGHQGTPHGLTEVDLRLHLGRQQQRLGLRRPHRQHRLVQHHARPLDAGRPVLPDRPRPGHRRLAGPQAGRSRRRPAPSPPARPLFAGLLVGVVAHRRRPHLLPRPRPRPHRRAPGPLMSTTTARNRDPDRHPDARNPPSSRGSLLDPAILTQAAIGRRRQARPAPDGPQPGHVRRRGRQRAHHHRLPPRPRVVDRRAQNLFAGLVAAVAVVHRAVRQLRRGHGRGPGQGPGRLAAQGPGRHRRPRPPADGAIVEVPQPAAPARRRVRRVGRAR